jgi:hypothetical protein
MLRATYFAELIDAESKLRKNGRNELFDALTAAHDSGVALMQIVLRFCQSAFRLEN